MQKLSKKILTFELSEPRFLVMRDLSKILNVINNLYNYYVLISEPEIQKKIKSKIEKSATKKPKIFLYSSSLERVMGRENRMEIISISKESPFNISLEGLGPAIDALRRLIELFSPIHWKTKKIELRIKELEINDIKLELEKKAIEIKKEERFVIEKDLEILNQIMKLKISADLRKYILISYIRNINSIKLNPVKPIV